jgi:hypothetical protein
MAPQHVRLKAQLETLRSHKPLWRCKALVIASVVSTDVRDPRKLICVNLRGKAAKSLPVVILQAPLRKLLVMLIMLMLGFQNMANMIAQLTWSCI